MPCYDPRKGWLVGKTVNGKNEYLRTSYSVDHLEKQPNGTWLKCYDSFHSPTHVCNDEWIPLPCGQCIGCRIQYSKDWADRCILEAQYHEQSYFVTLTYNDKYLPHSCDIDGVESDTLDFEDLSKFFKRLRKHYLDKYPDEPAPRHFACGEYGDLHGRPHYHAIIFGLKLDDLECIGIDSELHNKYYRSKFLDDVWSKWIQTSNYSGYYDPMGFVTVGEVSWETCAYVARYVVKKYKGESSSFYIEHGKIPESIRSSNKPGIANQYFLDNMLKIYDTDRIHISTSKGGKSFKPPAYFDKLFDEQFHDQMLDVKDLRKEKAEAYRSQLMQQTNLDYLSALKVQEEQFHQRTKGLIRHKKFK